MNTQQIVTIYTRAASDDLQACQRFLHEQEAECRAFCQLQGWQIGAVHSDSTHLRKSLLPGWKQVLADAHSKRMTHLVVPRVDRLGRDLREVVAVLTKFREMGIAIYAPNGCCFTADDLFEEIRQMASVIPGRMSRKHRR